MPRKRLLSESDIREEQALLMLTKAAHRAALADLEALVADSVNTEGSDYAVLSAVRIH
ncbi:MAG: hypothetical protein JSU96_00850 [Acidobacteriota bacterium]|nr:MAG: hypothetical protein JSU96_00850 [Acidobacteriota bacterium]